MSGFLWASGHLGWGIFSVAVFTGLWLLLGDLYWRLKSTRVAPLVAGMAGGWVVGVAVIVLVFFLAHR